MSPYGSIKSLLRHRFKPKHEELLRLIPDDQIADISSKSLSGANGTVFEATWSPPPAYLCTMQPKSLHVPVVLKQILPKFGDEKGREKFLVELDNTYAALTGSNLGCVKFLGFANLRVGAKNQPLSDSALPDEQANLASTERKLHLMFERADKGDFLVYLTDRLSNVPIGVESWRLILDKIIGIAEGLRTLHEHKVVHRDLHPGNVLVVTRHFPFDPEMDSSDEPVLSDFGESKLLFDRDDETLGLTIGRASYGKKQFRAPEIHGSTGWTVKADVFAFGMIFRSTILLRQTIQPAFSRYETVDKEERAQDPNLKQHLTTTTVPLVVREIVERCLDDNPERRPEMRSVIGEIEDLLYCLAEEPEEAQWEEWDVAVDSTTRFESQLSGRHEQSYDSNDFLYD